MEVGVKIQKLVGIIKKYRYSVIILIIGFVLMSIPTNRIRTQKTATSVDDSKKEIELEERLSQVLSQMSGAGNVKVVLTKAAGEEVIYQTDQESDSGGSSARSRSDTITVTDADRNQTGLIRQVNPVQYKGAIVLCQGADDPSIRLAIVDAISKATGLGSNKISVLKLK